MAILPQIAAMILKEHRHRPITGDILLIGRQAVYLSIEQAKRLLTAENVPLRQDFLAEMDSESRITDRSFFSMFSTAKVLALDVSAYENAEIVHDLNAPLDDRHRSYCRFHFQWQLLGQSFRPANSHQIHVQDA